MVQRAGLITDLEYFFYPSLSGQVLVNKLFSHYYEFIVEIEQDTQMFTIYSLTVVIHINVFGV